MQGIAGEIGQGSAIVLSPVSCDRDGFSIVLVRSHSVAVGLAISGFASPVSFTVWRLDARGGAKVGGRGEVDVVQGLREILG